MTKDEMKNRISMALKDPTLQQGFEIICKENAELKEQLGNIKMQKAGEKSNLVWKLMKHKDELEKENAGLKEQNIKAKEIIKILKDDLSMYSGAYQKEIAEAEQFLEEC